MGLGGWIRVGVSDSASGVLILVVELLVMSMAETTTSASASGVLLIKEGDY